MRLIIQYIVSDGCSYSYMVTEPVVYESKEALARHLTELCEYKLKNRDKPVHFKNGDVIIHITDLMLNGKYFLPAIYTIDEFFESNGHYND